VKAIVINEPGGPEKLELEDIAEPSPGPGQLLVDVVAAGVNFIDTYHRSGLYPMSFPLTPGLEGAGHVRRTGDGVDGFAVGDRVGWTGVLGSYAEKHVIPVDSAIPVPVDIDLNTMAAMLLQGLTAHYLATDTFPLSEGDKCLIHAGAGGVGLLLTQVAKMKGAYVITTVGTEDKAELSRDAGADHVIIYTAVDFKDAVEELVGEQALDVVFDGVGKTTFERSMDLIRPRGMMITFGNASGPVPDISPLVLMQKGSLFLTRPTMAHYLSSREELLGRANDLFDWVAAGKLHVRIGGEYSLARAGDAHRALQGRETTGKILILP